MILLDTLISFEK